MIRTLFATALAFVISAQQGAADGLAVWVAQCDYPADGKANFDSDVCKIFRNGMRWQRQKQIGETHHNSTVTVLGTRNGAPMIFQEQADIPFQPDNPEIYYDYARESDLLRQSLDALENGSEPPLIFVTPTLEAARPGTLRPGAQALQPAQRWSPFPQSNREIPLVLEDIR